MDVIWKDNYNIPYGGSLSISSVSGIGSGIVYISSVVDEGLDRHCELEVKSSNYEDAYDVLSLAQRGRRDVVSTFDGWIVRLVDGGTVNLLKE